MRDRDSDIVYSTDQGKICPVCGKAVAQCTCRKRNAVGRSDGIVRIGRETKGRKGKGVTVITGIALDHDGLQTLARQLKQKCGTGGTVKDGVIEIQGDHRTTLTEELKKQGYKIK